MKQGKELHTLDRLNLRKHKRDALNQLVPVTQLNAQLSPWDNNRPWISTGKQGEGGKALINPKKKVKTNTKGKTPPHTSSKT